MNQCFGSKSDEFTFYSCLGPRTVHKFIKGQLILKCLFGVFTFFQKRMKTSRQVVKLNLFVRFLEETSAWKNHFEFVWPLTVLLPIPFNKSPCFEVRVDVLGGGCGGCFLCSKEEMFPEIPLWLASLDPLALLFIMADNKGTGLFLTWIATVSALDDY